MKPSRLPRTIRVLGSLNLGLLLGAAHLPSQATTPPRYAVTDLGSLGGNVAMAFGLNENRQVVGAAQVSEAEGFHAFVYANGVMTDLGSVGGYYTVAKSINESGQIVGYGSTSGPNGFAEKTYAFLTQPSGGLTYLNSGFYHTLAFGINDHGQIVGAVLSATGDDTGFLYQSGQFSYLGTLGGHYSTAYSINNAGASAGFASTPDDIFHPAGFHLGQAALLTPLPWQGTAVKINDLGATTGYYSTPDQTRGFFQHDGLFTDLGTLGGLNCIATSLNNFGQVVGVAEGPTDASGGAFLWTAGQMEALNTLIDPASGWDLQRAEDINDHGDIVGYGLKDGQTRAFLLTLVPEPTTATLLLIASILYRRRIQPALTPAAARNTAHPHPQSSHPAAQ